MSTKCLFFILAVINFRTHSWAQSAKIANNSDREITEGKLNFGEPMTKNLVDEKQIKAIQLINTIGTASNNPFAREIDKENAQYAYNGFIARFQSIRAEREILESKEIIADNQSLLNYSLRLDKLIVDIQKFLK